LNLTLNTKYAYRFRLELTNASFCMETLNLNEHGQYILHVQTSAGNTSDSNIQCLLKSQRFTNNVYTPLIVGGVIFIALFIFMIVAQRMKLDEQFIKFKHHCFNQVPPQESTHSYDLQACPPANTICQPVMDTIDCTGNISKLPPIHKISHVIVPRSKRLLSLDTFRGFGRKISFVLFVLFCLPSTYILTRCL
jgi:hypothetical protein